MNQNPADELLTELRHQLEVTPSPEFSASVRARVAERPAATISRWWVWGSAAVATAAIAVVAMIPSAQVAPPDTHESAPVAAAVPPFASWTVPPVTAAPRPPAAMQRRVVVESEAAEPIVVRSTGALVPRDQAMALNALILGARGRRFTAPAEPDPLVELPVLPRVEIPPVRVEPLPDLTDVEGE